MQMGASSALALCLLLLRQNRRQEPMGVAPYLLSTGVCQILAKQHTYLLSQFCCCPTHHEILEPSCPPAPARPVPASLRFRPGRLEALRDLRHGNPLSTGSALLFYGYGFQLLKLLDRQLIVSGVAVGIDSPPQARKANAAPSVLARNREFVRTFGPQAPGPAE